MSLDRYPLIVCGPMLRRVTNRSVSVFLALTAPREVELTLHLVDPGSGQFGDPVQWHTGFAYPRAQTVPLGASLHVVLVTVDIPLTVGGQSVAGLVEGVRYGYDISLHDISLHDPTGGSAVPPSTLGDLGLLDGPHALGYQSGALPSFVVPPADAADLHIVHGSCRKPHGEGSDMLAGLDQYLQTVGDHADPAKRPHLLLLSGDQIYADDVDPVLLRTLHDAATTLLEWDETFPGTGPGIADPSGVLQQIRGAAAALLVAPPSGTLQQFADALSDAVVDSTLLDGVTDRVIRRAMRRQLRQFADQAQALLSSGVDATSGLVVASVDAVLRWLERNDEIFGNLSSGHHWGRVAVAAGAADKQIIAALRVELPALVGDVANSAETLAAAVRAKSGEAKGHELRRILDTLAAALTGLGPAADRAEIQALTDPVLTLFGVEGEPNPQLDYIPSRIAPPQRSKELAELSGLTSDAMTAHLMFFGEFLLMYILTWSPAAWPRDAAGNLQLPEFFDAVPNYATSGPLGRVSLNAGRTDLVAYAEGLGRVRRVLANIPTLMIFDDHEVSDDWNLNADWVTQVNTSPMGPQILRNALVACAIFQDWGNQPDDYSAPSPSNEATSVGVGAILLDAARSIGSGVGRTSTMLDPVAQLRLDRRLGIGPDVGNNLPAALLGAVTDPVFVDRTDDGTYVWIPGAGRKVWDWSYTPSDAATWNIIALDTRTRRAFPAEQWEFRVGLPWSTALGQLAGTPSGGPPVGGFVAAANLLESADLDRQLRSRLQADRLGIVISPAPVFGLPLIEDYLQRLTVLSANPEEADYESWIGNPDGFSALVSALRGAGTAPQRVLLVSGDVHYGSSNRLVIEGAGSPVAPVTQVCSSSMKNETGMTRLLAQLGREGVLSRILTGDVRVETLLLARDTLQEILTDIGVDIAENLDELWSLPVWFFETAPLLSFWDQQAWVEYYLALKDAMLLDVRWQLPRGILTVGASLAGAAFEDLTGHGLNGEPVLTVEFLTDRRPIDERRADAQALQLAGVPSLGAVSRIEAKLDDQRDILGLNNIGVITCSRSQPGGAVDTVEHALLWHPRAADGTPDDPIFVTRHGAPRIAPELPAELARIAQEEFDRWHPATGVITETSGEGHAILADYWTTMAVHHDRDLAAEPAFTVQIDGVTRRVVGFWKHYGQTGAVLPWSATFISWVVHRAGGGDRLFCSPRHIDFLRAAKGADIATHFTLLDRTDPAATPQVGDIVIAWRDSEFTVGDVETAHSANHRPAHCDIVVSVDAGSIVTIGGNLGQTVERTVVTLDNGRLPAAGNYIGLLRTQQ